MARSSLSRLVPLCLVFVATGGCDGQRQAVSSVDRRPGPSEPGDVAIQSPIEEEDDRGSAESAPASRQAIVGEDLTFELEATERSEGERSSARLDYRLEDSSGHESCFVPPGHPSFWFYGYRQAKAPPVEGSMALEHGVEQLTISLDRPEWRRARTPFQLTLKMTVRSNDTGAVLYERSEAILVHPAAVYVGVRPGKRFLPAREPIVAQALVVDPEGRVVHGRPVALAVTEHRTFPRPGGRGSGVTTVVDDEERAVGACTRTSGEMPVECRFPPERPGEYWIEARTHDDEGRESVSGTHLYIIGNPAPPWQSPESPEALQLALDREEYDVGDTARVMVRVPFSGGRGRVTLEQERVLDTQPLAIDGTIHVVSVPIVQDHAGGVDVVIQLVEPGDPPHREARGRITIPVRTRP